MRPAIPDLNKVTLARDVMHMTQGELAMALQVTSRTVADWETTNKRPKRFLVLALKQLLLDEARKMIALSETIGSD